MNKKSKKVVAELAKRFNTQFAEIVKMIHEVKTI